MNMNEQEITQQRLQNQHVAGNWLTPFTTPYEVVRWLGAVQAQEYWGGLWAIGLRLPGTTEADIEQAVAEGSIVRTWPMRGTIHFVAPEDVRWMLKLLTPRIIGRMARMYRQAELDEGVFAQSREVVISLLQGGKQLARRAVSQALEAAGIPTGNQRGLFIIGYLAQQGVICLGPRQGKQHTIVLLDEWVPPGKELEGEEALAELAKRYFTSHGPATVQDFAWWSGLTVGEAKAALEMVQGELVEEVRDGRSYWLSPAPPQAASPLPTALLLPPFDEYTVAYKDRTAAHPQANTAEIGHGIDANLIVNGQIIGTWKRALQKEQVTITPTYFIAPDAAEKRALEAAAAHFGSFLGRAVEADF